MEYILIIKTLLIGWFISGFEPLQNFLDKYIKPKIKYTYLKNALSCHKCLAFWTGIIYFQDFYVGAGAALLAYILNRVLIALPAYYNLNNNHQN